MTLRVFVANNITAYLSCRRPIISRLQLTNQVINLSLIPSTDVIELMSLKMPGCRNVSHCQEQSYSGLRSLGRSYLACSRRSDGVECDKSCASSPQRTRVIKKKNDGSNFSPAPHHLNAWNKLDHAQPTYYQLCLL